MPMRQEKMVNKNVVQNDKISLGSQFESAASHVHR